MSTKQGTESFQLPSWNKDSNNWQTQFQRSVTFDSAFTSVPTVVCSVNDSGPSSNNAYLNCMAGGTTQTGFTATVKFVESNSWTMIQGGTVIVSWFAVGD